ncbi:MAG: hypothetical protein V1772_03840, partial [Chloroflexota bacterium]
MAKRVFLHSICLGLCLVWGLMASRGVAQSQLRRGPTPAVMPRSAVLPRHLRETPRAIRPAVTTAAAGAQPAVHSALPPHYRECSSVVLQRWTDGNWEIYSVAGDGSGLVRLTYDPAADESPSSGAQCGRIAFSSDRGGNDDIYLMAGDGNDMRRVVSDLGDDMFPALSPDGGTIAFQTYRHGPQPEVYLLDVASGAQTRLTNDPAYDGQPAWSPDGQRLALISDRAGAKNVWLVNRDGSGLRQVTAWRHAGAPKWSPDGQRIALASDDLGTGFTALWVVGADGAAPRLVWRPTSTQSDAWPGGWSPDGRYLLYEEATWDYRDDWYVLQASLHLIAVDDPADRQALVAGGISMSASWDVCDSLAPSSQVQPLPLVSTSPVQVAWSGSDDCASQIAYQVQYRPGGAAAWLDWPLGGGEGWTQQTQAAFAWDRLGTLVRFRSRARDPFGHVEPWPAGAGDAYTIFPATLAGFVGDNRALPLPGARVTGPLDALPPVEAALDGRYVLRAASEADAWVEASATGYGTQRLARPEFDHMAGVDHYLSPAPELVTNG